MPRRIRYSPLAFADLTSIRRWQLQPGSGEAARRRLRSIVAAIDGLAAAPCRYQSGDQPGTRRMTVLRHVVIYVVDPDTGDNETAGDVLVLMAFSPGQSQEM